MLALGGYSVALNIIIYLSIQLLVPLMLTIWLWKSSNKSKTDWLIKFSVIGSYILLIFFVGFWHFFPYPTRYLILLLFIIATFISYRKVINKPNYVQKTPMILVLNCLSICVFILTTYLNITALKGRFFDGQPISLSFPLKDGIYVVDNGGNSTTINSHRINPIAQELDVVRAMQYAVDIHKLNRLGSNICRFPWTIPENIEIFDQIIYSPCEGKVIDIDDQYSNLSFEESMQVYQTRNPSDPPPTNHIIIKKNDIYIYMGHILKESVLVQQGDSVTVGQPIARVGGSGGFPPHLHIHAAKGSSKRAIWRGEGIPIEFDGRFLVRNALVFATKKD